MIGLSLEDMFLFHFLLHGILRDYYINSCNKVNE
jgi:hypothetical protein